MKNIKTVIGIIALLFIAVGSWSFFSVDTNGATSVRETPILTLRDGDSYTITADYVLKEVSGRNEKMLAYNGSIPGPTLRVVQGATVKVLFVNNTDVDNSIHFHGVRMDNAFDGVPGVTQPIVKSGETFEYTLTFPDAGIFWYHPHNRDDMTIENGLYGAVVVAPVGDHSWNTVSREEVLFVDDILLSRQGIVPFEKEYATYALMGRYGNTPFLNGSTAFNTTLKQGEVVRYYVINSANVRPFNISFSGARMKLVGGDNGLYEKDSFVDSVVIHPSERAIIEVSYDEPGTYTIINKASPSLMKLGTIAVLEGGIDAGAQETFELSTLHREVTESFVAVRNYATRAPDKELVLTLTMAGGMMDDMGHGSMMEGEVPKDGIEWDDAMPMINEMSTSEMVKWKLVDTATGNENMDIRWELKQGVPVKVRITNDGTSAHPMQHPIHFHGVRFAVVNRNGVSNENLVWKDTVTIPAGEYADIVLVPEKTGSWMAHCHILEHIEAGMMMAFIVT